MSQHGSDIELQIAALEVGSAQQLDVCNMGMQAVFVFFLLGGGGLGSFFFFCLALSFA